MSRVKKLSIRGIRNFDDRVEAKIKFSGPLTLIVGQNGVGKTTVIECLRYVTTGEFPPGSDRGKSFIHDPLLKGMNSVKIRGAVKAEFKDRNGDNFTVNRTIEASRYENNIKFKTLDNTISKINAKTKEEIMITHRCTDTDQEVMNMLGVSKAILNNVIFCHQDDSNWPLEDSRKLKERFDEIFDTVRYNKALEFLRKQAKVKQADIRVMNIEKKLLSDRVAEVMAKESKLNEYLERDAEALLKIEELMVALTPTKTRLEEIDEIVKQHHKLLVDEQTKKLELSLSYEQAKNLRSSIKEIFVGSDDDLAFEIISYDEILNTKNSKISHIESALRDINKSELQISTKLSKYRESLGTLRQQLKDQEKLIINRNSALTSALSLWEIDPVDSNNEAEVQSAIETIEKAIENFEHGVKMRRTLQDQEESRLEKIVDKLRNERSKIDCELKRNEQETDETREKIREVRTEISQADDSLDKLNNVNRKIEEIDKLIKQINEEIENENYNQKNHDESRKLEAFEIRYTMLDNQMSKMQKQSALNNKLESLKSELAAKYKEVDELKQKHGDIILRLLETDKLPEFHLKNCLDKVQETLIERLNKLREEISNEEFKAVSLETSVKHARQDLNSKIADIQYDKEKVLKHCPDYRSYDEFLLRQSKIVKNLQNKRGMIAYQEAAYSEYLEKLKAKDPCCPICDRGFPNPSEVETLLEKMNNDLKDHPALVKKCERELKEAQEVYDTLLSLKPTVEKIMKFEESTKQELDLHIERQVANWTKILEKIKEMKKLTIEPERKLELFKKVNSHVIVWDKYSDDIMRDEIRLDEFISSMPEVGALTKITIEELQSDRENLRELIKKTQEKVNTLRANHDMKNEKLKRANERRTKCLEEQLRIHKEVQRVKQLREKMTELTAKDALLRNSIQESRELLLSAQKILDNSISHLEEVKTEHREEQEKNQKTISEHSKQIYKLNSIHADVTDSISNEFEKKLKLIEAEMVELDEQIEQIKAERMSKNAELIQTKEDISCQQTNKRNLTDNAALRKEQKKLEAARLAYKEIEKKISALDYNEIMSEKKELTITYEGVDREINIAKGSRGEVMKNITHLQEELARDDCQSAKKLYGKKCSELAITEMAVEDLQTYAKVLDLAMTDYHVERMNSVNRTMKSLWELVYTGTDTSSIQIRTEASSGTETRRTFNYKLVQVKHGVEMDMRGRCSAGQRVLASIIMRLALAETFCDQCGILALDEPTTNLDEENAKSLASALFKYVSIRSRNQASFQLVIITHDENFISKLSQLSSQKCAYELYRNSDDGLTSIRYLEMEEIETFSQSLVEEATQPEQHNEKRSRNKDNLDDPQIAGISRKKAHTRDATKKKSVKFNTDF